LTNYEPYMSLRATGRSVAILVANPEGVKQSQWDCFGTFVPRNDPSGRIASASPRNDRALTL